MNAVVFDVDGTLTDGKIYMGTEGEVIKVFDVKDGCGIHDLMPAYDMIPIVITARQSKIVENRCREIGIAHIYQGCRDKAQKLDDIVSELQLSECEDGVYTDIAYMGDDIIDLPIMKKCKITGCPADAVAEVKACADFISTKRGGDGAVREFIDWLISGFSSP